MKKPIAIILAAIMMFALCACGNTATDSSDSGPHMCSHSAQLTPTSIPLPCRQKNSAKF